MAKAPFQTRGGYTLLELMLALSLTVLVLASISMAVNLHLKSFDARRTHLEESQLARAVLRMVADDIRSVVQSYEQDTSSIETLMSASAESAVASAAGGLAGDTGLDLGAAADDLLADEESTNTQDLATGVTLSKPGIYGNQYELQIDISRLPRDDEFQAMMMADPTTGLVDIPSDVKTVTYYVTADTTGAAGLPTEVTSPVNADPTKATSGLFRRQLDRAVTQFASQNGNAMGLRKNAEAIAPEIVGIEFQYFDGYEWRPEWDTEIEGVLPVAIQVTIALQSMRRSSDVNSNTSFATTVQSENQNVQFHRLLVRIPTGEPSQQENSSTSTTDSTASGTDASATSGAGS